MNYSHEMKSERVRNTFRTLHISFFGIIFLCMSRNKVASSCRILLEHCRDGRPILLYSEEGKTKNHGLVDEGPKKVWR